MANSKDYNINIKINGTEDARKKIDGVGSTVDSNAKKIQESSNGINSSFQNAAGSVVNNLGKIAIAAGAAYGAFNFLKAGIADAMQEDASITRLNGALKATGQFSNETSKALFNFADSLEKTSKFSTEQVLDQTAYAISMGRSAEEAKKLVAASADLSAVTGDSLDSSVTKLLATYQGVPGSLKKQIDGFSELTEAQLKSGEAVDFIAKKFRGAAEQDLNTYAGRLKQLNDAVDDVPKAFGVLVTKSPEIQAAFSEITKAIRAINNELENNSSPMSKFVGHLADFFGTAAKGANAVISGDFSAALMGYTNPKTLKQAENQIASVSKSIADFEKRNDPNEAGLELLYNRYEKLIKIRQEFIDQGSQSTKSGKPNKTAKVKLDQADQDKATGLNLDDQYLQIQIEKQNEYYTKLQEIKDRSFTSDRDREQAEIDAQTEYEAGKLEVLAAAQIAKNDATMAAWEAELANKVVIDNLTLAQDKLKNDALVAGAKKVADDTKATKKKAAEEERQIEQAKFQAASSFLSLGEALSKEGSESAKAFASANAVIATWAGVSKIMSDPTIPTAAAPFLIASQVAAGLANVARINNVKFANGGIFNAGGTSITGDANNARLNDREMVLDMTKQKTLFNAIDSGSIGMNGLSTELLAEIRDVFVAKNFIVNLDGQKLSSDLNDINNRNLK